MTIAVATSSAIACRLCGGRAGYGFGQTILGRHEVSYFRCGNCDLIQTEEPYWLEEAYSAVICGADSGAIRRNQLTADLASAVGWVLGVKADEACLDYGGGHGVFARMMRDRGWDFWVYDRYAENLYARKFAARWDGRYVMVTAFEVLEHLANVSGELDQVFACRPAIVLAGTQLHRGDEAGWWYYTPQTGQHVAFYSKQTMRHIAGRYGYEVSGSRAYTLFVRKDAGIADWRRSAAEWVVRHSRGDRNNWRVRGVLCLGPRFAGRTVADSGM